MAKDRGRARARGERASTSRGGHPAGGADRPAFERLEGRALLAAVSWDGGGGDTLWSNPLNWSGDAVPVASDDVTIDVPASQRWINVDVGPLWVRSLTLDDTLIINAGTALTVSGVFALTQNAELRINGTLNWVSGVWDTDRSARIQPGGRLNIGSAMNPDVGGVTLRSELDNRGTLAWRGGTLNLSATGTIVNNQGKRFEIASPSDLQPELGSVGTVVNHGVMRRGGSEQTSSVIDVDLENSPTGLITVLRGQLVLGDDRDGSQRAMTNAGRVYVAGGELSVENDATHTGATFSGGTITFWNGSQRVEGTARFLASAVWLRNNAWFVVDQGQSATIQGTLRSLARPLVVYGDLEIEGFVLLAGGPTSGRLVVEGDGSLEITGRVVGANLDLQMPVTIRRGGTLELITAGQGNSTRLRAPLTNLGAIDIASGEIWATDSGAIENSGVLRKSGDASVTITAPLTLVQGAQGTPEIEVQAGTLTIEQGGLESPGLIDVQAGTLELDLGGGSFNNAGRVLLGATGVLEVNGQFESTGTVVTSITSASFGRIVVSGQLALPSGRLRTVFVGDGFEDGQQRLVIESGSRAGMFTEFIQVGLPASLTAGVQHIATGVRVLVSAV